MSSASKPIPIVLVGATVEVGSPVAQGFSPEYEVIHFAHGHEAARAEVPLVLAGQDPHSSSTHGIGTRNYSETPRAVVIGRAFTVKDVENLRKLSAEHVKTPVAWILGDPAKKHDGPSGSEGPEYARQTVADARAALDKWYKDGASEDIFVLY